jgi:Flp pilus assembly protein TadD
MHHTCCTDNLDYSFPMKKICALILLAAVALAVAGCKTHSGSREYTPSQGWKYTD